FVQDQWRVTPHLTLNYGLRWDVDDRPKEFYDDYYKAVQPRLGIAYSLLADRLVLRASGGVYQGVSDADALAYCRIFGQDPALGLVNSNFSVVNTPLRPPFISNPSIAAPAFLQFAATGIYPKPGPGEPPFQHIALATPRANPRGVYTYQWNAQAEYRLTNDLALSLGHLGVRG